MSDVEKVARAIFEADREPGTFDWEQQSAALRDRYRSLARAALSALGGWNEAIEALKWYAGDGDGEQFYIVDKNGEKVADFSLFSSRAKKALDALRHPDGKAGE